MRFSVWSVTALKSIASFVAGAAVLGVSACAQTRSKDTSSPASTQSFLSLGFANNGQNVAATVGEQIQLTLGLAGPTHYGEPQISSSAVRLEETALPLQPHEPPSPGGGGWTTYFFRATREGEAQIKFSVVDAIDAEEAKTYAFSISIRVGPGAGNPTLRPSLKIDQENTEPWEGQRLSLANILRESFVPKRRMLTAVEVELEPVQPGRPATGDIDMLILGPEKMMVDNAWKTMSAMWVASMSKSVSADNCSHVLFLLPGGGMAVLPGGVYTIQLSGSGGVFGWKYVVAGYAHGVASAPHGSDPPLPDTRGTFLFKTFGTN
jgi:hypothetical protein